MGLSSLIFSHDDRTVRILKLLLSEFDIQSEHVTDFAQAQKRLWSRKYDAFFSECAEPEGASLLKSVRKSKHNQRSIVFALSDTAVKVSVAFDLGAHFVLQRPIAVEKVKRTLKAAHGLMMREQRSQFRHPAFAEVILKLDTGTVRQATLRDLTQGGAMIESTARLKRGQNVQVKFTLPDTTTSVEAKCSVTWYHPTGRTGLRFDLMTDSMKTALLEWVVARSIVPDEPPAPPPPPPAPAPEAAPVPDNDNPTDLEVEVVEPVEDNRLRATLRGQLLAPVKVLAFANSRPITVSGKCCNLSEYGLAADLDDDIESDRNVLLSVGLPETSDSIVVHAELRYNEGRRYGFEFVALSDTAREVLRSCVLDLPVE
ncbi:MAG TPA: PilZ domain-containing protein [Terriglobales bacterium]|nr:PilZ domain-containing protein [Terriglobales bacterium]